MKKDSERSHFHLTVPRSAMFFSEWMETPLEPSNVTVPPEHEPPNEDETDENGPDSEFQPTGFGGSSTHKHNRVPEWKDLGLDDLLARKNNRPYDRTFVQFPQLPKRDTEPAAPQRRPLR